MQRRSFFKLTGLLLLPVAGLLQGPEEDAVIALTYRGKIIGSAPTVFKVNSEMRVTFSEFKKQVPS